MNTNERLQSYFAAFRKKFEPELTAYLDTKLMSIRAFDPVGEVLAGTIKDFIVGSGKRVRATLTTLGYRIAGQETVADVFLPAIAIELLHSFFLIHDDIIDRSDIRRHRPTVHRIFQQRYQDTIEPISIEHFSNSMAILAGDLCCAMAYEALARSNFPPERIIAAINCMHTIIDATVVGQSLDILKPFEKSVPEETIIKIHLLKTAKYTFEGPLHVGMILGGADVTLLRLISNYAIPVGTAFQIQDDILGIFGSEKELGKPVSSDLEEGKQTLLTVFVRTHGAYAQSEKLESCLGKKRVSQEDIDAVRNLMVESGALAYCEKYARNLVMQGKQSLDQLIIPEDIHTILYDLADYVVDRTF